MSGRESCGTSRELDLGGRAGRHPAPARSWTDTLRFAFQPVVNPATGGFAGLEVLARPETGDILAEARQDPELDGRPAVLGVRAAVRRETLLPLHVNVFAGTCVAGHRAAAACLAPFKKAAKALGGASWVVGRAGLPGHEIRRGTAARTASKGYTVAEPGRG